MTLLELLVKELPKAGGWPNNFDWAELPLKNYSWKFIIGTGLAESCHSGKEQVTRDQYEAALAASQQPAWSGDGLPPVGSQVDIVDIHERLRYGQNESGEVVAHIENTAVVRMSYGLGCFEAEFLRPIRSEAECRRESVVDDLVETMIYFYGNPKGAESYKSLAERIFDAVAIGKIPGLRMSND